MLRDRLIFGTIFIVVPVGVFWFDAWLDTIALRGFWQDLFNGRDYLPAGMALLGLAALLVPLAAWELTRILRANDIKANTFLTCAAAEIGLFLHFTMPMGVSASFAVAVVATTLVAMFVTAIVFYSRNQNVEGVVAEFAYSPIYGASGRATCARTDASHFVQLRYEELGEKSRLCAQAPDLADSLSNLGFPCPNPEAFETQNLALPDSVFIRR